MKGIFSFIQSYMDSIYRTKVAESLDNDFWMESSFDCVCLFVGSQFSLLHLFIRTQYPDIETMYKVSCADFVPTVNTHYTFYDFIISFYSIWTYGLHSVTALNKHTMSWIKFGPNSIKAEKKVTVHSVATIPTSFDSQCWKHFTFGYAVGCWIVPLFICFDWTQSFRTQANGRTPDRLIHFS